MTQKKSAAKVAAAKTTMPFFDLLTRKSKDLEEETANIISRQVKTAYENIMRTHISNIDNLVMEQKKMKNINISNSLLDASRIDSKSFDGAEWVKNYDAISHKLFLAKAAAQVANQSFIEVIGYDYLDREGITFQTISVDE